MIFSHDFFKNKSQGHLLLVASCQDCTLFTHHHHQTIHVVLHFKSQPLSQLFYITLLFRKHRFNYHFNTKSELPLFSRTNTHVFHNLSITSLTLLIRNPPMLSTLSTDHLKNIPKSFKLFSILANFPFSPLTD